MVKRVLSARSSCLFGIFLHLHNLGLLEESRRGRLEGRGRDRRRGQDDPEPRSASHGAFAFDLVEDLAIGEEKDERYFFPGWVRSTSMKQGPDLCLRQRESPGPGLRQEREVSSGRWAVRARDPASTPFPRGLSRSAGDAYIETGRALVVFGRDGVFKKNVPVKTFLSTMILGPGGTIIGTTQPNIRAEGGPKNTLVQLGPDGELQRTLAVFPAYGASPGQMLLHWYSGEIAFCARSRIPFFTPFPSIT